MHCMEEGQPTLRNGRHDSMKRLGNSKVRKFATVSVAKEKCSGLLVDKSLADVAGQLNYSTW